MRLFCVLYATLVSRTLASSKDTVAQTRAIFHNFFDYNATKTFSTLAFEKTFGIENDATGDSVWPYLMTVHGDTLTSTSDTESLLKALFKGKIPLHRVLDKSHLQVFLAAEQLPSPSDISGLSIENQKKLPSNPLSPLPIGSRIGYHIFEQIANPPTENNQDDDGPAIVRFLVTLRDKSLLKAFSERTKKDLTSTETLLEMKNFREINTINGFDPATESSGDDLYTQTFITSAGSSTAPLPSDRFDGKVKLTSFLTNDRVAVDVTLKVGADFQAATFFLSFYFARNVEHVLYVDARPVEYPLAAHEAGFVQRGAQRQGVCDPMRHHSLLGNDVIIGLVDTGIDLTSSYLFSRSGPFCENDSSDSCGGVEAKNIGVASKKLQTAAGEQEFKYNEDARVVVRYDPAADSVESNQDGHGTFLAGVIAGAPNPSKAYGRCLEAKHKEARGVARAKIAFYDVGRGGEEALLTPAHDYKTMFIPAFAIGARLFTVAWGSGEYGDSFLNDERTPTGKGQYTAAASDIDSFMYEHKETLVVVAAGNSGPGFVTSPAISKNALTVGSLSSSGTSVSPFSSGGKQPDGRLKPDLVAMGDSVFGPRSKGTTTKPDSHCETTQKSGTSVSAALVTAAAAQVRQYFEAGFYPSGKASKDGEFKQDLWGSTVKAVLIAGAAPLADTLTGGRFDTSEGYGSLILSKVLPFKDDNQIDLQVTQDKVSPGKPYEQFIQIESDEKPLVVTLTWTDPAAVLGTQSPIVNQVELSIFEEVSQLEWSTETNMDQIGNVKRFHIPEPIPGRYRILVKPSFVTDEQDFSLVVTGRFAKKERSSPLCCARGSLPGAGGCLSVDAIICIIFVVVILVVVALSALVLLCHRSNAKKAAAEKQAKDAHKLYPL